jgi:hypothetical protein
MAGRRIPVGVVASTRRLGGLRPPKPPSEFRLRLLRPANGAPISPGMRRMSSAPAKFGSRPSYQKRAIRLPALPLRGI